MTHPSRQGPGRIAGRIAGTYPLAETYHAAALESEMIELTSRISDLVPEATGLELPGAPGTLVIGRTEWVERNVASFSHMIEPANRKLAERVADAGPGARGAAAMAGRLMQAEVTAVLGVLARRVLGQYELVLPTGEDGDVVAYVGPNIMSMERTHQFRPSEFRFWVALHESPIVPSSRVCPGSATTSSPWSTELVEQSTPEPGRLGPWSTNEMTRQAAGGARSSTNRSARAIRLFGAATG